MLVMAKNQDLHKWHFSLEIKDTSLCWSRPLTKICVNGILPLRLRTLVYAGHGR